MSIGGNQRGVDAHARALQPLLLQPELAWAGKKADQAALGSILVGPWLVGLLAFPIGLALQLLILGHAPRRGLALLRQLEAQPLKASLLGAVNTLFLAFLFLVAAKHNSALALLPALVWLVLTLVGSQGIARALGARILGREESAGAPADVSELALGWFVMVFAAALPLLGPFLAAYWAVRATGGVILTLLVSPPPAAPGLAPSGDAEA